ncbi:integrase core domain-containing protein [Pantoea ananatis]|uniref:integrase core domain-containing protein n=1 Tax=Pantoea ananas TaxID=553 RepID=UPI00119F926B
MVESFSGRPREECLKENWFMSQEDARCKIEAWRIHYNQRRPHYALGWMTPPEFSDCQNMQPYRSRISLIMNGSHTGTWST